MPSARIGHDLASEAARYLASQNRTPLTPAQAPAPTAASTVVLAGILHRARTHPDTPLPTLRTLTSGWTGYLPEDTAALQRLHAHRVLTLATTSPPEAFQHTDGILTLRTAHAHFELTGGPDPARALLDRMTTQLREDTPRASRQRDELARLVLDMEVRAVLRYTDAMLMTRHGLPAVPDELCEAYAGHVAHGLAAGYTCGQLATLAWRAGCAATDWGPLHTPADASAATVTFFEDHLARARADRSAVPEQDIPDWAGPPAALGAGRILLHHVATR